MPRTKRTKKPTIAKTKKKTAEHKELLAKKAQDLLKKYDRVLVFEHHNMTNVPFRQIQEAWAKDTKFLLGKNKVIQVGLGKDEENSASKNSYLLSEHLKGDRGLIFTNKSLDQIVKDLKGIEIDEYAKAGEIAPRTIVLEKGPKTFEKFAFSIEPYLRKLGLNTQLINQQIILNENFVLCEQGKAINVEQSKLLVFLIINKAIT